MKYLNLILLGSIMQFAAVNAGGCKDCCKKPKGDRFVECCNKDKKANKKADKKNHDKAEESKSV
ncbi:MAG: hypothetical protein JSR37_09555 [Verrucomicrobia bacterium]|nr:hypothetical protein [Verrucomicrobiota bacterium]MBS0637116.1 hypothetical protein [Verrucomicrobiota bacterium]